MNTAFEKPKFDVLIVGAGPAGLSCAYHLKKLLNNANLTEKKIAVLEKASEIGDHILSGALLNPQYLYKLIPNLDELKHPSLTKVTNDSVQILFKTFRFKLPITPPQMSNKTNVSVSLSELTRFLATLCENEGVEIYTAETGKEIIHQNDKVIGIRTGEKGLKKEGKRKCNYLPGTEISSNVTVFAEGSKGFLTKQLIETFNLSKDKLPQGHAIGVKEIWEVPDVDFRSGKVIHTMGFPLGLSTLGGGFLYHFEQNLIALGHVTSLDYKNPNLDPFEKFQEWKTHPLIKNQIKNGKMIEYGAKTISEGGYYCIPKLYGNGFLIIGESAGLLDSMKLKGIDIAIESGMISAETIFSALNKNDFTEQTFAKYETNLRKTPLFKDLYKRRNFHQGFHHGLIAGFIHTGLQIISFGRGLINRFKTKPDWECMVKLERPTKQCNCISFDCHPESSDSARQRRVSLWLKGSVFKNQKKPDSSITLFSQNDNNGIKLQPSSKASVPDNKITFDRLTDVYASGTTHEEDQPCHLHVNDPRICIEKCIKEYGNPCTKFCPAKVYEMIEDENGKPKLEINFTNCVHCKTCEIKDPYAIIDWFPPEAGGGPKYNKM